MTDPEDAAAQAEALRRRLYGPGATEEDRRRFAELSERARPAEQAAQTRPAEQAEQPPRPRRVRRGIAATAVLTVAAAALVAVGTRPGALFSAPPPTPTPSASQDVDASTRVTADLVRLRPDSPVAAVSAATVAGVPTRLQRSRGTGSEVVAIDVHDAQRTDGTLLVMLTPAGRACAAGLVRHQGGLRIRRLRVRPDRRERRPAGGRAR